ncbi:YceD family protein [Kamptonema cortianum]|nr:YceD family protein [Geitlerinema splendidum]MDK3157017.1 YceD family protein [Kamptonema cortianum]
MKRAGLLDLNEAVQNPGKHLDFSIETHLPQEEDLDLVAPITGELTAVSTGNALLINATFKTRCVLECARCAEPIEVDVEFEMEDDFAVEGVPACYGSDGYAHIEPDEDGLFEKNALVPDAYIRQGLLVSLPNQPLCSFGWEGDCPNARNLLSSSNTGGHPALQILEQFRTREDS